MAQTTELVKSKQIDYYGHDVDAEEELQRPRCYPRPVRFLLDFKLRSTLKPLSPIGSESHVLVACCGSGMDAEFAAHQGMHVVAMDISRDALVRARERAKRYGSDYHVVIGDAENMPFKDGIFDVALVHDGLHHLPDPYRGLREMMRVSSRCVGVAEPTNALLTRMAVKLRLSSDYEDAGNYVARLVPRRLAEAFRSGGARRWQFRQDLIYYQSWTFRFYRLFESRPLFLIFRLLFHTLNFLFGRWGNSLKAVAWKD